MRDSASCILTLKDDDFVGCEAVILFSNNADLNAKSTGYYISIKKSFN